MSKSYLGRAVIECGRHKHGKTERAHRILKFDQEGEPFPPQKKHTIELRDNLNPLERWLKAQVNKSWNKVYADFCSREDKRSLRGDHIHRHFKEMVKGAGSQELFFMYQPSYQPPCYQFHGYSRYWIDQKGFLRHHDGDDCAAYGRKVGWKKGEWERVYARPYVYKTPLMSAREKGKTDPWGLRRILKSMDERDRENPGWWLSAITAAKVLGEEAVQARRAV